MLAYLAPHGDHAAAGLELDVAEPDLRREALLPPRRHELLHALVVQVADLNQEDVARIEQVSVTLSKCNHLG